jgi:ergothioneine biosynthesis protein EgtB
VPPTSPAYAPAPAPGRSVGALGARYRTIRDYTESLAAPLSAEDQTVQSMPDASPTKWHRAHTTWFFETFLLEPHLPGYRAFDPAFGYLFNSYYEAVGARHPRAERGVVSRPGIAEIAAYRRAVDAAMNELMGRLAAGTGDDDGDGALVDLVELGLHHEQQHQELLLMDIQHVLSCNPTAPAYDAAAPAVTAPGAAWMDLTNRMPEWCAHAGGLATIGHDGDGFAFDNESPRHRAYLAAHELATRPVTCADWLAFVDDGGYERADLWLSDGWAAVHEGAWDAPLYWRRDGDTWSVFSLRGSGPIDPSAPVSHVSYYEADAYARWAGGRLPTESEWEAGVAASPTLAASTGSVWEWTSSAYLPYPGFRPAPGAVGEYNGKFMVNQHVLRGGCVATPPGHLRLTYRNFFPPSARWPFTGLRLARDI